MHYWLNPETGTVMTLEDHEKAEDTLTPGQFWLPVHLHPNIKPPADAKHTGTIPFEPPKDPRRKPPRLFTAGFLVFSSLVTIAAIAGAAALAILAVRGLVGVLS